MKFMVTYFVCLLCVCLLPAVTGELLKQECTPENSCMTIVPVPMVNLYSSETVTNRLTIGSLYFQDGSKEIGHVTDDGNLIVAPGHTKREIELIWWKERCKNKAALCA